MDEIILINEVKSPHHRDFSIAGVKTRIPGDQTEILAILDLRDRGIHFAGSLAVLANRHHERERAIESEVTDGWMDESTSSKFSSIERNVIALQFWTQLAPLSLTVRS
jgi:hypothetical protein